MNHLLGHQLRSSLSFLSLISRIRAVSWQIDSLLHTKFRLITRLDFRFKGTRRVWKQKLVGTRDPRKPRRFVFHLPRNSEWRSLFFLLLLLLLLSTFRLWNECLEELEKFPAGRCDAQPASFYVDRFHVDATWNKRVSDLSVYFHSLVTGPRMPRYVNNFYQILPTSNILFSHSLPF